ncbi:TetR/AcrR family transcriptional regulator [Brevibacterium daeguense]|uniref:TetR/AcrR family transcriptional regulator n=1 Tax=Brevibacterium daeguense TaxID=909936 RepID=A0ABP8EKA3_9MICO|nr:TetR family transcriptional regulator [Brevibacterium daeguense]
MSEEAERKVRKRAAPKFIDRETVISAVLEMFSTRGFHGASMRQIAAAASTSLSNLYNYFESKDELLEFVLENTARALADQLEAAVAEAGDDPADQLEAAVRSYVDFIVDQPQASTVGITEFRYLQGANRAEVVAQRDRTEATFRRAIEAGAASGAFSVADIGVATRGTVTLCNSMSTWYRPDGRLSRSELADLQADLVLGLVRAQRRAVPGQPSAGAR